METWPLREIGHSFPKILISFLEDEKSLKDLETFTSGLNCELARGFTHINSLRVDARQTQQSVAYRTSPFNRPSGELARTQRRGL